MAIQQLPRRERWRGLTGRLRDDLVADDLDTFDGVVLKVNTKLNWLIGLAMTFLVALVGNMVILLITLK